MKVLFIHRSVGQHLIKYGGLRQLLQTHSIKFDDFNSNDGVLTHNDGTTKNNVITMPGNNTNPDNLEAYFKNWDRKLDEYDLVMIKSCYPNSSIKSAEQLEMIKNQYTQIIKSFNDHKKQPLILTTPPLRPLMTNRLEVTRAESLAEWLKAQTSKNIHVFDFRNQLTDRKGYLRAGYRHWSMPWDNHPKARAHKAIAPVLANFIAKCEYNISN